MRPTGSQAIELRRSGYESGATKGRKGIRRKLKMSLFGKQYLPSLPETMGQRGLGSSRTC